MDDIIYQEDDLPSSVTDEPDLDPWKIMIVDDEPDIHQLTNFTLSHYKYAGKTLKFISAYSEEEARKLLRKHQDLSIVLLDVVMENDDSGLRLVEFIRNELQNKFVRIVLRTAHPGQAPEKTVIFKYEIDDYREKTELTGDKFFALITTALRSYSNIIDAEYNRQNLEIIVEERTRELEEAKNKAELAAKAQAQFLSNMSHEIRTPLNSILGYTQLLLKNDPDNPLPEKFSKYLRNISLAGENLLELTNNILELTKVQAGKVQVSDEEIDLRLLVENVFQISRGQALSKGIDFQFSFDPLLTPIVRSDKTKLNQILINLVGNAIKFTPNGKEIRLAAIRDGEYTVFEIRDMGIGIPAKQQASIFDTFQQVDMSGPSHLGGVGLGLSIVKALVEALGGEIKVESGLGKGSVFTVKLILREAILEGKSSGEEDGWDKAIFSKNNAVLLVEDDPGNMQMISELFRHLGLEIYLAENGRKGLEMIFDLKPDLVLMDLHMPEMDGVEVIKQVRACSEYSDIPIIVLTADVFSEKQNELAGLDLAGRLTKPLNLNELLPHLQRHLRPA